MKTEGFGSALRVQVRVGCPWVGIRCDCLHKLASLPSDLFTHDCCLHACSDAILHVCLGRHVLIASMYREALGTITSAGAQSPQ